MIKSFAPFVGRCCVVQLADGNQWFACNSVEQRPEDAAMLIVSDPESKRPTPVPFPVLQGEIVETADGGHAVAIRDQRGAVLHVAISADRILSITVVAKAPSAIQIG